MPLFESKKAKNDEIRPVLDDESVSRDAVSAFAILEEKIGQDQIANANRILRKYKEGKANLERKIIDNEQWFKLRHWECMRSNNEEVRPVSAWLLNCILNKHAEAMDSYPTPSILPREESDRGEAEMLSSVIPVILDQNDFEQIYSDVWFYKLKSGTGVYGVFWDKDKLSGLGDIAVKKIDLINLFWESGVTDIQKSRNLFHVELQDNDILEASYPFLEGKLGGITQDLARYIYDDTVDTSGKSAVVDWYYKKKSGGRTVLHYAKYVNDQLLYDTTAVVTPPLSGWGTLTVSASVTDSRGFVGTAERTVTVLPYSKPYPIPADGESMIKCLRATDNGVEDSGGERLRVKIKKGFSPLTSGGTDRNRGVLSYRHKPASTPASDYGAWVTLLDEYEGNTFDGIIPGLKLDLSTGHSIQFRVSDLTGNSNIITLSVQSEAVTLHLAEGGEGLAVGMYSSNGGFEVGFDSHFYGDVHGRAMGMGGVPFLPDGTDLNDCREFGVYAVINNEKAKTMLNIPIAEAGTLRVWSGLGISKNNGTWVYIVQDYINFTGRKRYSRYLFTMDDASVWTVADWIEI